MKQRIYLKGLLVWLFINGCGLLLFAQTDCPPVVKLKELYANEASFRANVDTMFANVKDISEGVPNPWKGKTIEDLYPFLNEWFYFLPNTENGLDYIIEFSFLYYKNPAGMKFILEAPGRDWSLFFIEERGKYMDSPESTKNITEWLCNESIGNKEYIESAEGFDSFNDFFTRELKPGVRSINAPNDNSILVSPADGVINMIANDLSLETEIPTKGTQTLNLTKLLDHSIYAEKFIGGTALAVFLMPTNYHHFHAPIAGTLVEANEQVGDRLFGMPDILDMINNGNPGYNKDYSVFQDFKHGYLVIDTKDFGHVAMIPIGLQTIGSVVFEDKFKLVQPPNSTRIEKGEKIGHFAYGGSTVLLIFEKGRLNAITIQQGQRIGQLKSGK